MSVNGIFYVSIYSSDLEQSRRFYADKLGWKLGTNEEYVAGFHFGSGYLVILSDNRGENERHYASGMQVAIQVNDVHSEHARLRASGVHVGDLVDQPWGERHFSFSDPDGYVWFYSQTPDHSV